MLLPTGREPLDLPLPSLLDVISAWWVDGGTEKDVAGFRQALEAPPATAELKSRSFLGCTSLSMAVCALTAGIGAESPVAAIARV
ncbi:hypothetical protein Q3V37_17905 [Micromonospora profundi]|uniref:Uncharacterized protein n=2 Tax=Micromonospora TaxID=1873 RepID=A0AAJ6HQS2_9ACTN|nr:hypothetical protein [Micromonospora profundi]WLS43293.1 hypothetical protein Q3V37_17905 [Micromonospora profundi]